MEEPIGMENDSKVSNVAPAPEVNHHHVKAEDKPSECKIPKTDSGDSKTDEDNNEPSEMIDVKVVYNKNKYDVSAPANTTIADFKKQLQELVGVPNTMQKLMYKGLLQDNQTLGSIGITRGAKIMLVGSTLIDVLAVSIPNKPEQSDAEKASASKEPLCKQKLHRKILDKGVPEDAMPAFVWCNENLPTVPLSGMVNKHGSKIRLTFKLEADQLWLSTKERTEKLPMGSIKNIVSEAIAEHEEYHILGLQLGPTEASRYWIYWVPAQYVEAIKNAILGQWQLE